MPTPPPIQMDPPDKLDTLHQDLQHVKGLLAQINRGVGCLVTMAAVFMLACLLGLLANVK